MIEQLGTRKESTVMFSVNVKSMFPSLKRSAIFQMVEEEMRGRKIKDWDCDRMKKTLSTVWENSYFFIGDKIVRMNEGPSIGSCIRPVIAYLVVNRWEKIVMEKGGDRLLLFCRLC